jgi:hypothetical protein
METNENISRIKFKELSTRELKKIYFRAQSINSIAAIMFVSILGFILKAEIIRRYGGEDIIRDTISHPLNAATLLLTVLAFIGFVKRAQWGRLVGIATFIF